MIQDALRMLPRASWRGIEFDVESMTHALSQDLVEHKYYARDGALLEATGRGPQEFTFKIPFLNGISRPAGSDLPYPDVWQEFVTACADGKTGTLQHPELGPVNVKCKSINTAWDVNTRDGVRVDVTFTETLTRADEELQLFADPRPNAQAVNYAIDLDSALSDVAYDEDLPESLQPDLLTTINQLNSLDDQLAASIGNVRAAYDNVLSGLDELINTLTSEDSPALQAAIDAALLLYSATIGAAEELINGGARQITVVTVETEVPTTTAASTFGMTLPELLRLNPTLGDSTSVLAGTTIYVYA